MRYAAWESRLSKLDEHGTPTRAHLRAAAKRGSALAISELDGPRFPEELGYLWLWFLELRRGIRVGLDGSGITWTDLDAWARRTRRNPEPHEVEALFQIDRVWHDPASLEVA